MTPYEPPQTVDLEQLLLDAIEIRSACGFMWMRMAVAQDAQDAYDVAKREFADHEAAFTRLETSLPAALAALVRPRKVPEHYRNEARALNALKESA